MRVTVVGRSVGTGAECGLRGPVSVDPSRGRRAATGRDRGRGR